MSWKKILILFIVLLALGVAIHFVNQQEKQKQAQEGKLFSMAADKIAKLELLRGEVKYVFTRSGAVWNLEEPLKTQADKTAVENMLDEFGTLKYDKMVEKEARDLKNYGLDQPRLRLNLFEAGMTKPAYAILVGMKNEIDQSSYVKLTTGNEVVMVASYKINYLEKELFDFRNKKFMGFESTDVSAFNYTYEGSSFAFAKKEGKWIMEKPLFSVADDSKVSEIVSKAASLEAKAFKEKSAADKLKEYGFEKPVVDVTFKLKDKDKTVKVAKKDDKYYAHTPDFSEICEIDKEFADKFTKEVKDLRSNKIAQFSSFDVREMAMKTPQLEFQAKKNKENTWESATAKAAGKIKEDQVSSLLSALEDLSASEFIDQPAKDTRFVYTFKIKLDEAAGQPEKSLEIQLSEAQNDTVIARNPSLPYQFKVAKEILDKIPKSLDGLIEKAKTEAAKAK